MPDQTQTVILYHKAHSKLTSGQVMMTFSGKARAPVQRPAPRDDSPHTNVHACASLSRAAILAD